MWCCMIAITALNVMPVATNHAMRSFQILIFEISHRSLTAIGLSTQTTLHSNIVNGNGFAVAVRHLTT